MGPLLPSSFGFVFGIVRGHFASTIRTRIVFGEPLTITTTTTTHEKNEAKRREIPVASNGSSIMHASFPRWSRGIVTGLNLLAQDDGRSG